MENHDETSEEGEVALKFSKTFLERFEVCIEICYLKQSYAVSVCSLFSFLHAADFTSLHFTSLHFIFSFHFHYQQIGSSRKGLLTQRGLLSTSLGLVPPPHLFLLHSYTYIFISSFHLFLSLSEKVFLNIDNYSSGSHLSTYVIHTSLYLS